jgi:hypothetical protein
MGCASVGILDKISFATSKWPRIGLYGGILLVESVL